MGQTSFSERLPLFGVWDGGQRLGHRRCPCARPPPHSRAVGQNAGAEHRKHLGERLTRAQHAPPHPGCILPACLGTREQPPTENAQIQVGKMNPEKLGGFVRRNTRP